MGNQSCRYTVALPQDDLNGLEAIGKLDKAITDAEHQQPKTDPAVDIVASEASLQLAMNITKAVEEDSAMLARTTWIPELVDRTHGAFATLNKLRSHPAGEDRTRGDLTQTKNPGFALTAQPSLYSGCGDNLHPEVSHKRKRADSHGTTLESISRDMKRRYPYDASEASSSVEGSVPLQAEGTSPEELFILPKTECTGCGCEDPDQLVKALCEHYFCRDCLEYLVALHMETHDGNPPNCCTVPFLYNTIASNVSDDLLGRYHARQDEIRNAMPLYCGVPECSVKIRSDEIYEPKATCSACLRQTCTLCREALTKS